MRIGELKWLAPLQFRTMTTPAPKNFLEYLHAPDLNGVAQLPCQGVDTLLPRLQALPWTLPKRPNPERPSAKRCWPRSMA